MTPRGWGIIALGVQVYFEGSMICTCMLCYSVILKRQWIVKCILKTSKFLGDLMTQGARAPSQYPKRRLSVRSRKVSKPRDWYFKLYRFEIWQAHRQQCCRSACQILERSENSKYKSRGFETLRDLTERRLFGYWDGAQVVEWYYFIVSTQTSDEINMT